MLKRIAEGLVSYFNDDFGKVENHKEAFVQIVNQKVTMLDGDSLEYIS